MSYRPIRTTLQFAEDKVVQGFRLPPSDLTYLVLEYWDIRVTDRDAIVPVQILPHGTLSIRFNITQNDVEAVLYGPSIKGKMQGVFSGETEVIGAAIKPEKAYNLIGLSVEELRDYRLQMQLLWPQEIAMLKERLLETRDLNGRLDLISNFLRTVSREDIEPSTDYQAALDALLTCPGDQSLDDVMSSQNISGRTLRRHFNKYLGLGPKHMSRVIRFQRAMKGLSQFPMLGLADIAADAGYFDQSHFTKEFKQLTSITPEHFRSQIGHFHEQELAMWKDLAPFVPNCNPMPSFKFR